MAVTTDEILARGKSPVAPVDGALAGVTVPPTVAQPATSAPATTAAPQVTVQPKDRTEHAVEVTTDTEQATPVDERQTAPRKMTYTEMYQQMSPYKPPTPEDLEKERKKQKREAIFAAIGEGISAMSNLYFTTQYAPNAFDPSQGMAATTKKRFDQLKKEHEDNQRQYMEGFMRAMRWDAEDADRDKSWRHSLERERISDERYAVKAAQDNALADLNAKLKGHLITKADYDAGIAKIKADHAEEDANLHTEGLREGVKQKRAAAAASRASANASNARADYYRNGGGGKKGPKLQLEDDSPMLFDNETDYDRTVMRLAPDYNVPTTVTEITETYQHGTKKGQPKKQRTVQRPVKDIAADIEREAAKRKKIKTMPGVASKKMPGVK